MTTQFTRLSLIVKSRDKHACQTDCTISEKEKKDDLSAHEQCMNKFH